MKRGGREPESVEIVLLPDPAEEPTSPPSGNSGPSTGARWLALITAAAVIVAIVIVNRQPEQQAGLAVPLAETSVTPKVSQPSEPTQADPLQDWEESIRSSASEAAENEPPVPCEDTNNETAFNSVPSTTKTGVQVLVGAGAIVNLDSGGITQPTVAIGVDEKVEQAVRVADRTFLMISPCELFGESARIVVLGDGVPPQDIPVTLEGEERLIGLQAVGSNIYAAVYTPGDGELTLVPLLDAPPIDLPDDFQIGYVDGPWLVGADFVPGAKSGTARILNTDTGETRELGEVQLDDMSATLVSRNGQIVWVSPVDDNKVGMLKVYNIADDTTVDLEWSTPEGFSGTTLSADGRYVAGSIIGSSDDIDPDTASDNFLFPSELAVIDLKTGSVSKVPHLYNRELLTNGTDIAFADEGHILVITATNSDGLHILTWRPGDPDLKEVAGTVVEDSYSNYRPVILPAG